MTEPPAAVVLAGGRIAPDLAAATGAATRGLIEIGGRPLLATVLEALLETPAAPVVVVGPPDLQPAVPAGARLVSEAGDLVDNLFAGLRACTDDRLPSVGPGALDSTAPCLICTADLPFVRAEHFADFIRRARATGAALVYPIVAKARCDARFPSARRTYATLREGTFTGGNVVFVNPVVLAGQAVRIRALYAARKSPLRLAGLLGLPLIWGLLTKSATLPQVEWKFSQLLGAPARAVVTPHAEIGFDVDKVADWEVARGV